MDGWSVLAELKADPETAEIPVILVSMLDDLKAGYALGASEFMVKPVDRERLTRKVEHDVARPRRGQAVQRDVLVLGVVERVFELIEPAHR